METRCDCGSVRLYTRAGAVVTIPVTVVPLDYGAMLANVESMISAGFSVNPPGLEGGEQLEQVGFVVRGLHDDGRESTPFLLLYSADPAQKFSFLKVYLNTDDDVREFEAASGMALNSIQQYIGQDKPERGKSRQVDQFIVAVKKPFAAIYIDNPRWSQQASDAAKSKGEIYAVPRRKFLRWQASDKPASAKNGTPTPPPTVPSGTAAAANGSIQAPGAAKTWHPTGDATLLAQHERFFRESKSPAELDNHFRGFRAMWTRFTKAQYQQAEKLKNDRIAAMAVANAPAEANPGDPIPF